MALFVCFFGGDSQAGTTTLALAAAEALAKKEKRVLLLFASLQAGDCADEKGAEDFSALLRLSSIEKEDVQRCLSKGKGFDYIRGPEDLLKKQFFDPDCIEAVLRHCGKEYDYILADAGCDATLGLPAACLALADRRYFVTPGTPKCMRRFHRTLELLVKGLCTITPQDRLLVNRHGPFGGMYGPREMQEAFQIEAVPFPVFADGMDYELQQSSPYGKDKNFTLAIDQRLLPLLPEKDGSR